VKIATKALLKTSNIIFMAIKLIKSTLGEENESM
jgi:hypothetical protein